jgi:Predicted translation initiation factor 2B subunit, eIF-2B alpha/beta/delta family
MSTGKQLEVIRLQEDGKAVIILDQTKLPNHELLTGIVTERGIVYPPFAENLKKLFNK